MNLGFLSNFFCEKKIKETAKFTRKIDKNFKTGVILAHFDFLSNFF